MSRLETDGVLAMTGSRPSASRPDRITVCLFFFFFLRPGKRSLTDAEAHVTVAKVAAPLFSAPRRICATQSPRRWWKNAIQIRLVPIAAGERHAVSAARKSQVARRFLVVSGAVNHVLPPNFHFQSLDSHLILTGSEKRQSRGGITRANPSRHCPCSFFAVKKKTCPFFPAWSFPFSHRRRSTNVNVSPLILAQCRKPGTPPPAPNMDTTIIATAIAGTTHQT